MRILPSNLLAVGKRDTPLELSQIVRFSFFAMIEIKLFYQFDGTISLSKFSRSRVARILTIRCQCFPHFCFIPSMPGALSFCILFKFLLTASLVGGLRLIFSMSYPADSSSSIDSSTGISRGIFNTLLKSVLALSL